MNKDTELIELLDSIEETKKGTLVRDLLNKAIQKAFTAGYLQANVVTGDCVGTYSSESRLHQLDFSDQVGEIRTLLNVYTQHNGY